MHQPSRQAHWQNVYATKGEQDVSWFQEHPALSLQLIEAAGAPPSTSVIDVGGGASHLPDALLEAGYEDVTVLDVSEAALAASRRRLGSRAEKINWIVADATTWQAPRSFDVWHDRAMFHFLTDASDRAGYIACMRQAVRPGGTVIIGTFAPDGPDKCSSLPVMRYDAKALAATLGEPFVLVDTMRHTHTTPWGSTQHFQFSVFRRI